MTYNWKTPVRLVLCSTIFLCQQLWAAELESIEWKTGATPDTLSLVLDGAAEHRIESLDGDQRLRVVLPDSGIAEGVSDMSGRGVVKSVFPYVADDGQSVHVDLLLTEPGSLKVTPTDRGLDIVAAAGGGAATASSEGREVGASGSGEANTLTDINYTTLPGGRIQVNLSMTRPPEQPGHFSTNRPPRLAFDFFNTRSELQAPLTKIGVGAVESITTVEAEDRTRVVFNLVRPVPYDTQITDDGIVFVIHNPDTQSARVERTDPKPFAKQSAAKHSIENIDFRRSREGGGRVTVRLSDPNVGVDVQEQAGEIIIDFLNTAIDDDLEQRLDVVDFATPVQFIDTFQEGNTVRMVVTPQGRYQHLA
ncbi:MAG TPA: AMIN domain-containing protein, partial [Arenicellales bacterium]|nr:AMIN domain-containing protein [Arenicellales bacterium]